MRVQRPRTRRGRPSQPAPKTLPLDLYDYDNDPEPRCGVLRDMPLLGPDGQALRVTDDWPDDIPVTEAEIEVFERWFGDVFDEMFGGIPDIPGLKKLSSYDNEKP